MRNNSRTTISDGTTLIASPPLRRLQQILQDLIIEGYERSTNRPGNSLSLQRFQYAFEEKNDVRSYTHFDVLVKDHDLNENVPLTLIIAVNAPEFGGL